jgi:hypothetical protein
MKPIKMKLPCGAEIEVVRHPWNSVFYLAQVTQLDGRNIAKTAKEGEPWEVDSPTIRLLFHRSTIKPLQLLLRRLRDREERKAK